jgi:hypothetical protein
MNGYDYLINYFLTTSPYFGPEASPAMVGPTGFSLLLPILVSSSYFPSLSFSLFSLKSLVFRLNTIFLDVVFFNEEQYIKIICAKNIYIKNNIIYHIINLLYRCYTINNFFDFFLNKY